MPYLSPVNEYPAPTFEQHRHTSGVSSKQSVDTPQPMQSHGAKSSAFTYYLQLVTLTALTAMLGCVLTLFHVFSPLDMFLQWLAVPSTPLLSRLIICNAGICGSAGLLVGHITHSVYAWWTYRPTNHTARPSIATVRPQTPDQTMPVHQFAYSPPHPAQSIHSPLPLPQSSEAKLPTPMLF